MFVREDEERVRFFVASRQRREQRERAPAAKKSRSDYSVERLQKTPVKKKTGMFYSFIKVNGIFVASGYRDIDQSFVHE